MSTIVEMDTQVVGTTELVIHGAEEIIDSDNDGLPDEDETNIHNTDPLDPDSDDDNLMDGYEIFNSSTAQSIQTPMTIFSMMVKRFSPS